jgi:hypothetical protein
MIVQFCRRLLAGILLATSADAADFSAAEALIAPGQVRLGMSIADLKAVRPKVFEGPETRRPDDVQNRMWPTLMEVIDLGKPSQASFWYLFSNDKLIGLLRTRNLVLVSSEGRNAEASAAYDAFAGLLGVPRQESLLRKGDRSFVPVRADVWTDDAARLSFYFIATTKEITTAVVTPSDFPTEQVFIRPDPKRFEIEDKKSQTVNDLPRSQAQAGESASRANESPASIPSLPQIKQRTLTPSSDLLKVEQPKADQRSVGQWAMGIVIVLVVVWLAWRVISKSHPSETK